MRRSKLVLLALTTALFAWGLAELFTLRYAAGDIYPEFSTFRADPKGTKALADAMRLLPGVEVRRNLDPLANLDGQRGTTLFILGADAGATMDLSWKGALERLARQGSRVVLAFDTGEEATGSEPPPPARAVLPVPATGPKKDAESLPFGFTLVCPPAGAAAPANAERRAAIDSLPERLAWPGRCRFSEARPAWQVIYARGEAPVVLERTLGQGSLVALASARRFSNQLLRDERSSALLSWLLGPSSTLLFDETHLGVVSQPGVMALLLRYRLHGLLGGLALLAGLGLWRITARFPPPAAETRSAETRSMESGGPSSQSGLANLLRRAIPRQELAALCLREWLRANPRSAPELARQLAEAIAASPDALTGYRSAATILAQRRKRS